MFSAAQVLEICALQIISQAIIAPIFRPRSITNAWLKKHFSDPA
jgi:hypothetical protein